MDRLRGGFADGDEPAIGTWGNYAEAPALAPAITPSPVFAQDERRMQVRAYNFWASLLGDRAFPDVADLDPAALPDFGPHGVLLDFSQGLENPEIAWLGAELAQECGTDGAIQRLDDVPSRSLLSRITDHYMQILANQAPVGFEAEFVNQRGATILYRGILLPFSRHHLAIDCIYGVINWKEQAGSPTGMEPAAGPADPIDRLPLPRAAAPLTEWADGPADGAFALPPVGFGSAAPHALDLVEAGLITGLNTGLPEDAPLGPDLAASDILELTADMELADWLASARELAQAAHRAEDRSRQALYAALGRAYDFALAAEQAPEDYAELVQDAGLKVQERAPLMPLVKLVFGADYDKTRLTEFATVIAHGRRLGLEQGALAPHIAGADGGIKALVRDERRLRREDDRDAAPAESRRDRVARGLRALQPLPMEDLGRSGEFTVLVARRNEAGELVLLGEVADDEALLGRAARHLLG